MNTKMSSPMSKNINKKTQNMKLSLYEKQEISDYFQPLVDEFKLQCIVDNPDRSHNYVVDVYTKWHQNFIYFCQKFKSEYPNRIVDEFEVKIVRLKCIKQNQFNFSYFRHTEQWHLVDENLTREECLKLILSNRVFQP